MAVGNAGGNKAESIGGNGGSMESPLEMLLIENSLQNDMQILHSKTKFLGLIKR